jgi:methionine sulfoxide reductase heme-binding subunit
VTTTDPSQHVFWLASRALGIVAIVLLSLSVSLGLALSGRLLRRPGLPAKLKHHHEAFTLVTLGFVAAHAGVLLLDAYLRPSLAGVTLPFALGYRPLWTGIGAIGAWLALVIAGSFYVRRTIGIRTWRRLHRWTVAVYILALAHAVGAGTDGHSPWMLALLTILVAPNILALAYRLRPAAPATRARTTPPQTPDRQPVPTPSPMNVNSSTLSPRLFCGPPGRGANVK